MTREDVERALICVAAEARTDPEAATSRERRLLRDVLMTIGEDATASGALARAALRTFELRFQRIT